MTETMIRFAIAGCGMISQTHLKALRDIEDAGLAGVFDTDRTAAAQTAATWNTKQYASYQQLLEDPEADAVCICTPSFLHAEMARQALLHGKHVLVEKPLALNTQDCDMLIALAQQKKLQLGVVSQLRFSQAVQQVRQALAKGVLGRLTRADLYMKYYRSQQYYDNGNWRGTWEKDGGGALMNQGIHGVDLLLYLMGPVKSIYAAAGTLVRDIEVEDTLAAVLKYQNGAIGVIEASTADWPGAPRRLEVNGEYGRIILEEDRIALFEVEGEKNYSLYEDKGGDSFAHKDPNGIDSAGHCEQLKNFISAVRGDTELLVSARQGRAAVELILAAYHSQSSELPVQLNQR